MLLFTGLVPVIAAAWIFRPHFHADPALVEPRLRALVTPYHNVDADFYFDGGSVAITITDARGCSERFFIPCREHYQKVYLGPRGAPGYGVAAANHEATIQELAAILADSMHCEEDYICLPEVSGRLGDRIKWTLLSAWLDLEAWWHQQKP